LLVLHQPCHLKNSNNNDRVWSLLGEAFHGYFRIQDINVMVGSSIQSKNPPVAVLSGLPQASGERFGDGMFFGVGWALGSPDQPRHAHDCQIFSARALGGRRMPKYEGVGQPPKEWVFTDGRADRF